ncbi:uncharacterized protein LOC107043389 [Diachasma alloeum]|uniref:uncharacterized protein LOC107043389 n=1 Tax=Diachasma alloeum TaxID=454923 RepID=UPI0007384564|nr:uncharacterized protein LOC107043389 [Diachasma alloeum]
MQEDEGTTDDALNSEFEKQDEYKKQYHEVKFKVQALEPPPVIPPIQVVQGDNPQVIQAIHHNRRYNLPKIQPPKFDGELKNYLQWWSLFKPIHEDQTILKEEKFTYLVQGMVEGSKAAELVKSFPPTPENYDDAVASLRNHFGKKELLVETYVRELLKLVLSNAVNNKEIKELSSIYDQLKTQLRVLESMGVTTDMCAAMLYPLVESSLPEELLRAWQRHSSTLQIPDAKERLNKFMDFLEAEVEADQRIDMARKGFSISTSTQSENNESKSKKKSKSESKSIPTAAGLLATKSAASAVCIFCDGSHDSTACEKARKMTLTERTELAKKKNACFKCLKTNHSYRTCRLKDTCGWCGKRHVLLMCRERTESSGAKETSKVETKELNLANFSSDPEVLLQTLKVKIVNGKAEREVRAIIDTGSHRSYVLATIAESMKYEVLEQKTMIHSLFGGSRTQPQQHNTYKVRLKSIDDTFACNFVAYDQEIICHNIPKVSNGLWVEELRRKSVKLSDVGEGPLPIALLIGADVAGKLYTGDVLNLQSGLTAVGTRLGWTLMGKTQQNAGQSDSVLSTISMFTQEASVSDLWSLDVLGITDPVEKKTKEMHQREVLDKFIDTTIVNEEGRYETLLPWKETHPPLTDNRGMAEKRLAGVLNKLQSSNFLSDYQEVFNNWLEEGIIEKVPDHEVSKDSYYLPHRPVIKEGSTTRIRPVFDASAKTKLGTSLNDCLQPGPNLIELIPNLLMRFRERRIGIIADIRKAFLQISIGPEDRDNLRFLWKASSDELEYQVYRHRRVVFGVSSSPFILGATLDLHLDRAIASEDNESDREILGQLKQSFYVDNCVTSVDTLERAKSFQEVATKTLKAGEFDLRDWEHSGMSGVKAESFVLGLKWNRVNDTLSLVYTVLQEQPPELITKRIILSIAQKLFDPLGMICSVLIYPKLLLQKLWDEQLGWDTEMDIKTRDSFTSWLEQLNYLRELIIPRWIFGADIAEASIYLHAFVDASNTAYAAVIYARVELHDEVDVRFVFAKSRVAPKGSTTIPPLELLGATVGARLMHSVVSALTDKQPELHYWTDSSTVLAWIQRDKPWGTFVWNRIQEIRRLSEAKAWRHLPGTLNPADLPSRGCTAKQLVDSGWHKGPDWLRLPPEQWPSTTVNADEAEVSKEIRKTVNKSTKQQKTLESSSTCLVATEGSTDQREGETHWYLRRFSRYSKIIRLFA